MTLAGASWGDTMHHALRSDFRNRIRRHARRTIAASVVGIPAVLVAGWLLLQHKPGWYRPVVLDAAGLQRASQEAAAAAAFISDNMVLAKPFDVELADESVNEWLAAQPRLWPDRELALPAQLSRPALRFSGGQVFVGAHYENDGWRAIATLALTPQLSADGKELKIALARAGVGSLPMPQWILAWLLAPPSPTSPMDAAAPSGDSEGRPSSFRAVRSVEDLFAGVRVANRFVWPNGSRPFRIESISLQDGRLRMRLVPL